MSFALASAETQRAEKRLTYGLDQHSKTDLAGVGDGIDFEVTLNTYPHSYRRQVVENPPPYMLMIITTHSSNRETLLMLPALGTRLLSTMPRMKNTQYVFLRPI